MFTILKKIVPIENVQQKVKTQNLIMNVLNWQQQKMNYYLNVKKLKKQKKWQYYDFSNVTMIRKNTHPYFNNIICTKCGKNDICVACQDIKRACCNNCAKDICSIVKINNILSTKYNNVYKLVEFNCNNEEKINNKIKHKLYCIKHQQYFETNYNSLNQFVFSCPRCTGSKNNFIMRELLQKITYHLLLNLN